MISVIKSPNTNQKFLLLDAPTKRTLPKYIDAFKQETSIGDNEYDAEELEKATGIKVNDDIKFEDGGVPSPEAISRWLEIVAKAKEKDTTVGVHCIAGIGRAPVLVAISLVEGGMDPLDAIAYIRKYRRGALNKNQVRFIDKYQKSSKSKKKLFGWW
ncbi:protein-tyrosine phosphatase-like protein, partial [Mucor lusitanicus]